jgi:uncharacterized protein (TIGR02145 family)
MKKLLMLLFGMLILATTALAQVGIGTTTPNASAMLDVYSVDKGLLIPRMETSKRLNMTPVNGMMVYDSDLNQFFVYEKGGWVWMGTGDATWNRNAFFFRTTLANSGDNVGIGTSSPAEQLHITKNFRFPASTTTTGNIYKDADLFLHNFGTQNTFLGLLSGNLTLTGSNNTALGYRSLYPNSTGLKNTAVGSGALAANTTGNLSVAIGYDALNNQSGNAADNNLANTAIGVESLRLLTPTSVTNGRYNTSLGYRSGYSLSTGYSNVIIGYQAAQSGTVMTTGYENVIIGYNADAGDDARSNVVLIGANTQATKKNQVRLGNDLIDGFFCMGAYNGTSTDPANVVVDATGQIMRSSAPVTTGTGVANKVAFWNGTGSLNYNNNFHWDNTNQRLGIGASLPSSKLTVGNGTYATFAVEAPAGLTGTKNILAGIGAGGVLTTGKNNSLYGHNAGFHLTMGSSNVVMGKEALYTSTIGSLNIAVGDSALFSNTSGNINAAIGNEALFANTTGNSNIAIGNKALHQNTTRSYLVAIGDSAMYSNTTGIQNTAVGSKALYSNTTGFDNIATGERALFSNTTGYNNTASGFKAMQSNIAGGSNVAFGTRALESNTAGNSNAAFGFEALNRTTTGYSNVAVGAGTSYSTTTGSRSVAIGDSALYSATTTSGNVALGYKAGYHEVGGNRFYVDNQPRSDMNDGRSKAMMYGTFAAEPEDQKLGINANVGVGTTLPNASAILDVTSSTKGVLISRLTTTQRNAVSNPAEGLIIYNTTTDKFEYYDGSAWKTMISTLSSSGSGAEGSGYCSEGVTDYDGHHYSSVKIGSRCWMAENLASTHYSNGSSITGIYCYNDYDWMNYSYGRLYTWAALMNGASSSNSKPSGVQGVCPQGWHVPGDDEWKEMEMSIGMFQIEADMEDWRGVLHKEGKKLKQTADVYLWNADPGSMAGNNVSGFTALPGGCRLPTGDYVFLTEIAFFWSSTQESTDNTFYRSLVYNSDLVGRFHYPKTAALSVRCVKDY